LNQSKAKNDLRFQLQIFKHQKIIAFHYLDATNRKHITISQNQTFFYTCYVMPKHVYKLAVQAEFISTTL